MPISVPLDDATPAAAAPSTCAQLPSGHRVSQKGAHNDRNTMDLAVGQQPSNSLAYTNRVYVSHPDWEFLLSRVGNPEASKIEDDALLITVNGLVFAVSPNKGIETGNIGLNSLQRRFGVFTLTQRVKVDIFESNAGLALTSVIVRVDLLAKGKVKSPLLLATEEMAGAFKAAFLSQVLQTQQPVAWDFRGTKLELIIESFQNLIPGGNCPNAGQLLQPTDVVFTKEKGAMVALSGANSGAPRDNIINPDFDFGKLGIGGLGNEFNQIFRRAFASRVFPGHIVKQLGINHVRGMLLWGPPGCGKTLIARTIGKILNAREPKIVNGPEVLDKYVGGSEERIRELFKDAEKEQQEMGDGSGLHVIIFDEIDAICKSRGSSRDSTGVSDSIVNQLLSKIDGVNSLNNILVIGMTNRKDMIDEAVLRPGRLEVHVEIGLPDEEGRLQIISIHTKSMREHKRIAPEAVGKLAELARATKNYSGAEIEGLVKSAASFAFQRNVNVKDLSQLKEEELIVEWADFQRALLEVPPRLGANSEELEVLFRNGIVPYGSSFDAIMMTLRRFVQQVRVSDRTPLLSVLLEGAPSTGKTAIAASLGVQSEFPFVRVVSADAMVGFSETAKCSAILKAFQDSSRSPLSVIVLDDLERLIDYSPIGPRFSNTVVQTLLVLLKKPPTSPDKRLLVIGTTSVAAHLEDLQLVQGFNVMLTVPQLTGPEEIKTVLREVVTSLSQKEMDDITSAISQPIGIKQLLMVTEMARQGEETVSTDRFLECLHICGF
ncbi:n-ethylmaleimide-sensitive fusion protein [Nannochloropsis gaditana]|uniref:Vesicle-fusing ATPase n=1 Tax=Nannochloropsis gaditana TaxID=72520 RepID=W7T4M8_9STRA|nr:n-ethylmaleimide-sensitive fusion protein [Nannochloropsis gaditana]